MKVNTILLRLMLVLALGTLFLVACSSATSPDEDVAVDTEPVDAGEESEEADSAPVEPQEEAEEQGDEEQVSDPMVAEALEATSGQSFDGQTVVVVGVAGQQGEFLKTAAAGWEEATGATVELNLMPFGELQDKVLVALSTGAFIGDVLNVPAYMDGDLFGGGFVEPVPDDVKARLAWDDIMPLYQQQTDWGGETYGYPWDGDIHSMYYRQDLLDDPEHQAAFEEQFGYALDVPTTWQEFQDTATYFTGDEAAEVTYGSVELIMRKNQGFHGFVSRATCYVKMPDSAGIFFDPETMDARINNPGWVAALEDLVAILPYSPPDMPNFGFIENAQTFVGGDAALNVQWLDIGPMSNDPDMSIVQGNIGYAKSPGCLRVYDADAGEWVEFDEVNYAPYAAFGGWQNIVPANAENKEAAIDLAAYYSSPPILKLASTTAGSGVNPSRYSTLEDVDIWVETAGFPSAEDAQGYLTMIQVVQEHPNTVFQLRLPGYIQYQDALELAVSKAVAGQATPQEALDEAAAAWDEITDRLGRDAQRDLYRASLGLN